MSKAINWPKQFYEEIINEDSHNPKIALRIGSLYFDNGYYTKDEIVDIRVDNKVVRKGIILEEMKLMKIGELSDEILLMYKTSLRNKKNVADFLSNNYNQPVDYNTTVTVITYRNLDKEDGNTVDDPHF